jgi:choline dehydrogenase-like flavoprotein
MQIMVKAKDELGGRLTDSGGIRKVLDATEKGKLSKGSERARKILKNAGAKGIFKTGYLAAHPGGTVKVGQLVDSNLQTEYDNLYVCDCSVIPEAWGLPPTSTIIGLGKRLAKYLFSTKHSADDQQRETPVPDEMDQPALVS